MKFYLPFIFTVTTFLFFNSLNARKSDVLQPIIKPKVRLAAGCSPAVSKAILELNNVRTLIEGTGGSMWQDRANSLAFYRVPKPTSSSEPKRSSIYAGGLWMGGTDVNGQLKLAAVLFRTNGKNDFWPGPLDLTTAEVTQDVCTKFDKHFRITRKQVAQLRLWYATINDPSKTLDEVGLSGYVIPDEIQSYPGNSGLPNTYSTTLAPFFDSNGDGAYDPSDGDYPYYEFDNSAACGNDRSPRLYGDETIWFVFNDKGNTHTETNAPSIGMEIHGQAFAFTTDDEVNNMTFYNYRLINRSVFTLKNTFFAQYADTDLGFSSDDFVGSDVSRGLGYTYNGDDNDDPSGSLSSPGYGTTPPAIGIDFFQGPYQDNDLIDNPLTKVVKDAIDSNGIPYEGLGIGYGDGVIDNERYGMKKFLYFNRAGTGPGFSVNPTAPANFYGLMQGIWIDGAKMIWGGQGHPSSSNTKVECDYLFPGDSDPLKWSSRGIDATPENWTEASVNNAPGDRRMVQSAGPFTLKPGAVNDLTVGVVWARAASGGNLESIKDLFAADDKAQLLFDNCFKIIEGPDAPVITVQELDREIILYLDNPRLGNNFNESYSEEKSDILIPDVIDGKTLSPSEKRALKVYTFQGYQIYQGVDGTVTPGDIGDLTKVRLVAQCDIQDDVVNLINYEISKINGTTVRIPLAKVSGASNTGIKHSFRITNDLFTTTPDPLLVNHKTYYYFAVAYGFNQYKKYDATDINLIDGQKEPYIRSRKRGDAQSITTVPATPQDPTPRKNGVVLKSAYGDVPEITRIEGLGNGGLSIELTAESEAKILADNFMDNPVYKAGKGPVNIKVINPLNIKNKVYILKFLTDRSTDSLEFANWIMYDKDDITDTIAKSSRNIELGTEQLLPSYGISINIEQPKRQFGKAFDNSLVGSTSYKNGFISATVEFKDPSKRWLTGVPDGEGITGSNWILSGNTSFTTPPAQNSRYIDRVFEHNTAGASVFLDPDEDFESMLQGTWAPYPLVAQAFAGGNSSTEVDATNRPGFDQAFIRFNSNLKRTSSYPIDYLSSIDLVITSDKSKWSRSVVLESQFNVTQAEGGAKFMFLRESPSVDKEGKADKSGTKGLGWFPGYAIDLERGERLNIAFAEDSWLAGSNGRDMIWNPTSNITQGIFDPVIGGKHFVYIFRNDGGARTNRYDESATIHKFIENNISQVQQARLLSEIMYAGIPLLDESGTLLETDVRIKFRVEKRYAKYNTQSAANNGLPMYEINMNSVAPDIDNSTARANTLNAINVVPNPYYGHSSYEINRLDNKVKITRLPEKCKVSIYSSNGTLVRFFNKADVNTSLDWDLRNQNKVLVASGVYYIHINTDTFGEKILKLVAIIKPVDITSF